MTAFILGNRVGILGECGRLNEAVETAKAALPLMKRSLAYSLDALAFLFWRCDRPAVAGLVLGASDAKLANDRSGREQNEVRLIDQLPPALEVAMGAEIYLETTAKGGAMDALELHQIMDRTLSALSAGPETCASPEPLQSRC